ncbi:riboflavin synthase, alpha subunit [Anaeromyxobacter dehalogenans 2CP-1]|uniref:Riboflavin synthase n=1 Tax=Anaeromyxobacter dehalogenans (strain ATCC BAA-258 / DSM 21875 / 2CP-1) TaxID=455488 RepID=B8JEW6_ANAD2|nr:riboflavin synthase [Anaeromyxobacter dehalogenans]ACL66262.1 riboflavin synthase, alpha subunit [Anaeromyxobacter dehalogenans 2CP-1]
MFTGLVADVGVVERIVPRQGGARLTLRPARLPVDELVLGESIACSGACLTVVERGGGLVSFDAVPETLARTTVGGWRPGAKVNLERALAVGERLGGHLVQGHVDAVGEVLRRVPEGQGARLTISLPPSIAPLVAEKGSIAVDGVSLTVATAGRDRFELALIPETLARTTLGQAAAGTKVNLEADVLARHVARLRAFEGLGAGDLARWGYAAEEKP